MRIKTKRHLRALRHTSINPKRFFFKSTIAKWLLFFLILIGFWWILEGPLFRIKNITCLNQDNKICNEVVIAELNTHKNKSTFLVNSKEIKAKLEKANPAYQDILVIAKLPDILNVKMTDKAQYANLKVASNSATFVVDKNFLIVDKTPNPSPGLFTIISPSAVNLGVGDHILDETLLKTFQIASLLKKNYLTFDQLNMISPSHVSIVLPDGKTVIFTTTKDIARQVTSLQLILSKATISPEPREIDMRFDKPVLKY